MIWAMNEVKCFKTQYKHFTITLMAHYFMHFLNVRMDLQPDHVARPFTKSRRHELLVANTIDASITLTNFSADMDRRPTD